MLITNNSENKAFGASIPVYYYAKDNSGKVWRIMKPENIKKCNSYVIRNLTGSLKNINTELVDQFKRADSEYCFSGNVRSVYDNTRSLVYLVTGMQDCSVIDKMGSKLGITKSESLQRVQTTKTFEVMEASKNFFDNALSYVKQAVIRKKDKEGANINLHLLFDAQYKKNGEIKGFKFSKMQFLKENNR